jgi:uncharacterized membrane protein
MIAEPASPLWLALVYWLHMLATVIWIGGLAGLALIVLPAAQRILEAGSYAAFIEQLQERLQQVGWLSLLILGATGMFQMSANPNYGGLLAIENRWALAILSKHAAILLMVVVSAYSTWGLLPQIKRTALMRAAGRAVDERALRGLHARENMLLRANLLLSVVVLALTAWARVS